jgi:hypothetical protein
MDEDLERRLAVARQRVAVLRSHLSRDSMPLLLAAHEEQLQAERDLAGARGEQYAQVIDIGPKWDIGAPLPHLVSNGSRAYVVCFADEPDPDWDGTYVTMVSPADENPSPLMVIELRGCRDIWLGGPNDEGVHGHPLYGRGLEAYRAHEVLNSAWIQEAIRVNSVHPNHSDPSFRQLHHYVLLFHDEMVEALACGIEARLVRGTMRVVLGDLVGSLIDRTYRAVE